MAVVEAERASYAYEDGALALKDVSLSVSRGERVGILGPNGAGKSTLLHLLAGLRRASSGSVRIFGEELTRKNERRLMARVGLLFQDSDDQLIMPRVWDDVAFGPINLGMDERKVERRVRRALELAGLEGYEERVPHHLSMGEKKRVALAGILAMNPGVILLDEPTANLDPASRRKLIELLNELHRKGRTLVMASHDMAAVAELADRVYVLNKTVLREGSLREIMLDTALLEANNLEVPDVARLFRVLRCFGLDCSSLPLSMEQAVEELVASIESRGGHVHLHIHEHTPEELERLRRSQLRLKGADHQHLE